MQIVWMNWVEFEDDIGLFLNFKHLNMSGNTKG